MTAELPKKLAAPFPGVWDRTYVASKVKTDPLYGAVYDELSDSSLPLLDLGCGLGLLAFYLRERGLAFPIHGVDYDPRKIASARKAAAALKHGDLSFDSHDARQGLPEHMGNVTILDILQFFTPEEQQKLLGLAASRVAPGGKLVIRSGLRDSSRRFKVTVFCDYVAKITFWMKAAPTHYPSGEDFERILSPHGTVTVSPLWGGTPFNNHLIVLEKA
ncbi:methyltransferase domain-containing protein [Luteolibacter arcticus]|uniref:Methyltransferase domain-containing protein n=1 Tax=Luteolibacter arcticus TaxID=1581411 RepID=A0ABT3GR09_9BACT|nr:methyltransferase domain-containing protein [Luteolibacter arcticus]MCW1925960.1 methyltransferase domain-containing protein [Luteolibacter arcticus]